MRKVGKMVTDADRLRRFERGALVLLSGCIGVLLLEAASGAYAGPENFGDALTAWPLHVRIVLGVGVMASMVPFTPLARHLLMRLAALLLVVASAVWVGIGLAIVLLYSFAMHGFD